MLNITMSNALYFDSNDVPKGVYRKVRRKMRVEDPSHYKSRKRGVNDENQSMYLNLFEKDENGIISIPRGCMNYLTKILKDNDVEYKLIDKRLILPKADIPDMKWTLRPYQAKASKKAVLITQGVLQAPCFVKGSSVKTIDGYKNIEDVSVGDLVYAYDVERDKLVLRKVLNHFKKTLNERLVKVTIEMNDECWEILCTENHKFYSQGEWIKAKDLKGRKVLVDNNPDMKIGICTNVEYIDLDEEYVYDLEVEEHHNYFVEDVLVHNCGSGKTIIGVDIISKVKQPTLVVCPDTEICYQWVERLTEALGMDEEDIGMIGDGYDYVTDVTVATVQSLYKRVHDKDFCNQFGMVILDECFHKDTIISTTSGDKKISDVNIGDYVFNMDGIGMVKNVFKNKVHLDRLVLLKLNNGKEILTTKEHLFFTDDGWVECEDLFIGDILYGNDKDMPDMFERVPNKRRGTEVLLGEMSQNKIYMSELWGRFSVPQKKRFSYTRVLFNKLWTRIQKNKISGNIRTFNKQSLRRRFCFSGIETWEDGSKKEFYSYEKEQPYETSGSCGEDDFNERRKWHVKSLDRGTWWEWKNNKTPRNVIPILERFDTTESSNGIRYRVRETPRGLSYELQSRPILHKTEVSNRGGWEKSQEDYFYKERQKERSEIRGIRVESITFYEYGNRNESFESYLTSEEISCGYTTLYDLEVDRHPSYYAEGVLVHNCHMVGARTFREVMHAFNAKYRYGLTATPFRNDNLTDLVEYYCGLKFFEITDEDLDKENLLIKPVLKVRETKFFIQYNRRDMQMNNKYLKAMMLDKARNKMICRDILSEVKDNRLVLVVAKRSEHCALLNEMLEKMDGDVRVADMSGSDYDKASADMARKGEIDVIVSVNRAVQGLDIKNLETLMMVAPRKARGEMIQIVGRIQRPSDCNGKYKDPMDKQAKIFDYYDSAMEFGAKVSFEERMEVYASKCSNMSDYDY